MVESPPADAGDAGSCPGPGRSHMPRSGWAREPWPLSLRVRSLCPATGEATTVRGPCTAKKKKKNYFICAVHGPPTVVASPVVEHRLRTRRLSGYGSRAQPLRGMWESSRTRARTCVLCIGRRTPNHCTTREAPGGFLTTTTPGKSSIVLF